MDTARGILEEYVKSGNLMQVATISETGHPAVCNVWYNVLFRPDRLHFLSRRDRNHSANIRNDSRVAGGIVAIPLYGLGQTVRGVTFAGQARELSAGAETELENFLERWPQARNAISTERIANDDALSRLYEIRIDEWILFDEENFAESPRRVLHAQ
jgi:uncharacterized protein YhbP (UPF0306 family)